MIKEEHIVIVANLLLAACPDKEIEQTLIKCSLTEEDIFLCLIAGKLLFKTQCEATKAELNKPPPFGRK